jgi:hypothetical protein
VEAAMVKNRFEQVDAPQPDAITLVLWKLGDMAYGRVTIPAALSDGKLPADMTSDKLPAKDAFRGAIHLGNKIQAPVVVIDPEALWQAEWGELYREM